MDGFDSTTSFGCEVSKRYDHGTRGDEGETAFLARLAGGRDALESAVGTGRIALPLMRAGVRVDGIEQSRDMVDRMREKPGGNTVEVTIGGIPAHPRRPGRHARPCAPLHSPEHRHHTVGGWRRGDVPYSFCLSPGRASHLEVARDR